MEEIAKIVGVLVTAISGGVSYWYFLRKRYRTKADEFKEVFIADIGSYQSEDTTLGATVLVLFPKHNKAFKKFLIYAPKRKRRWLLNTWRSYEEVYTPFKSAGVFGAVMAELPHPDFKTTPENLSAVERKMKTRIVAVLSEFREKL